MCVHVWLVQFCRSGDSVSAISDQEQRTLVFGVHSNTALIQCAEDTPKSPESSKSPTTPHTLNLDKPFPVVGSSALTKPFATKPQLPPFHSSEQDKGSEKNVVQAQGVEE